MPNLWQSREAAPQSRSTVMTATAIVDPAAGHALRLVAERIRQAGAA